MNLRRFLTPGWLLGFVAVVAFAVACFMLLAPWQLGKNQQLNARNDRLTESTTAPPVSLTEAQSATDPASLEWHVVSATGRYDTDPHHQVLLRLRSVNGALAYQVLTPFFSDNGTTVLVNRGWVPVGEAGAVPEFAAPPPGQVTIAGRWRLPETEPLDPTEVHGFQTVRTFNVPELTSLPSQFGMTYSPQYLALTPDQPGTLTALPTPGIESGPYLSYGLQWIAFGIIAPAALIYFVTSEVRNRRAAARLAASSANSRAVGDGDRGAQVGSKALGEQAVSADGQHPAAPAAEESSAESSTKTASSPVPHNDAVEDREITDAEDRSDPDEQARLLHSRYGDAFNAAENRRGRRSRSRF